MPYEMIDIPLNAGLNTKADAKSLNPPDLVAASDIQFDDVGGIQTRPQFQAITDAAGNTIADIRKLAVYQDELVAFSKDKLWSYSSGDGLWTERAEYLAVKVDEDSRFVTTGEQFDCDRAELGGIVMFCWSETTPSGTTSYVAAVDKASGSVKLGKTALASGEVRPKLLAGGTRIFLICHGSSANTLVCRAYDPATLTADTGSVAVTSLDAFDAIVNPTNTGEVLAAGSRASNYRIYSFQSDATATTEATRTITTDGAIAIAMNEADGEIAIVYSATGQIKADFYDEAYASVANDIAVGTGIGVTTDQVSAIYQGDSDLRVFWSNGESTSFTPAFTVETNTCTNAGADTETVVAMRVGLASKPFIHDSQVFIWVAFAGVSTGAITGQLQNAYFLFRSDGLLVAKAVATSAGGFAINEGHLPTVQPLGSGSFAWCGIQRGIVILGQDQKGYSARSPQEIVFEFDSNEARRTAQLGKTLYIAGGIVSQYDGSNIAELGFHAFPWHLSISAGATGLLTGSYNYKQTYSWFNAQGEFERSTTASIATSATLSTDKATVTGINLHLSAKTGDGGEVSIEYWRQVASAPFGAPFYLVSSRDPAATGDNKYQENSLVGGSITSFSDNISDADLISRPTNEENAGLSLESLAPTAAKIVIATQERLIFAGIPGAPNRVSYTLLRKNGEVARCNDALSVDLPSEGGDVTAIGFLNETLIVFKEHAIYALPGDGYDNNGGGQNYGPARILNSDVGALNAESVALTPKGLVFKSAKGWFLLDHGQSAIYVGGAVADYDSETILAVCSMEDQQQVRFQTASRLLVWDYLVNQWSSWSLSGSVDGVVWNGVHHLVNATADGIIAQADTHSGAGDLPQLDLETAWVKPDGLQGYALVRRLLLLGERLGAHDLRIRVAYNYDDTWIDDKTWTVSPAVAGTLQLEHGLSRPKCESVKFRITAQAIGAATAPVTSALNLTGMSLEVKRKNNHFGKGMGAAQKQ